jgi:uncharacterized cupredoxin-like copper-binding protein
MVQLLTLCKKTLWIALALVVCLGVIFPFPAIAVATSTNAEVVNVDLGNASNELKFFPNELKLVAGKRYKLVLNNPSPQKHYFTAKDFADNSWTQKVEAGKVEIKGAIHELELKPSAIAEWILIPEKPGTYSLRCPIAGHTEAGMTGKIIIADE